MLLLLTARCQQPFRRFLQVSHDVRRDEGERRMLQPTVPAWFEIPVADLERAVSFYQELLGASLQRETMGPMEMAVFPHGSDAPSGALVRARGYEPAAAGTVVYLHLDDIRPALERVGKAGGAVLLPRTALPDEAGFFAQLRDSEGNRVGVFSRS
jgi:predicted enzyme related to lactoylglutathione lyase